MKVLPKGINFSETAPASVEEMKDGEMMTTPDGLYARVGNQILLKNLPEAVTGIIGTYFDIGAGEGHILRAARESFGATWVDIGGGHSPDQEDIGAVVSCGDGIWLALTQWTGMHVLKSVDNGLTWQDKGALFTTYEAYAIAHLGNGIVVVGASDPSGTIYRSIDYGDNWVDLGVQVIGAYIWEIEHLEDGIVLAGTDSSALARSEDYGATWQDMGPIGASSDIPCIVYMGNGVVVAGTDDGLYKSYDYGLNWERKSGFSPWAIVYLGNGVLVSSDGTDAWRSTDGGELWESLGTIPNANDFWKMAHLGGDIIVGGGWGNGYLARTTDAGDNWSNLPLIPNHDFTEAIASDIVKILDWVDLGFRALISNATDGAISNNELTWAAAHDAETGDWVGDTQTEYASPYLENVGNYTIRRTFIDFDITVPEGKVITSALLRLYGMASAGEHNTSLQQGTQALPLTLADFDSFTGGLLTPVLFWDKDDWNDFTLNAAGLAYLNSLGTGLQSAKFCVRNHDNDYLDVTIPETAKAQGMQFSEGVNAPTLILTLADAPSTTTTTTTTT